MDCCNEIYNLDNINDEIIKEDGIELLIISYGGCCSNLLSSVMEKNGYKCRTNLWHKILCHCPNYININIPILYIYDNPVKSFLSQKQRGKGIWDLNQQKLSNNMNIELSDENLLQLMIKQFNSWSNNKKENILFIKTNELFEHEIVNKLESFLKKKITHFPIEYIPPNTINEEIENFNCTELFKKYELEIDKINQYRQ